MNKQLKACPFCGCSMSVRSNRDWHRLVGDHDEQCVFVEEETMMVPATDEQLAVVVADWNRRAQDFDTLAQRLQEAERLLEEAGGWLPSLRLNGYAKTTELSDKIDAFLVGKDGNP